MAHTTKNICITRISLAYNKKRRSQYEWHIFTNRTHNIRNKLIVQEEKIGFSRYGKTQELFRMLKANRFWCCHFNGLPLVPNIKNFTSFTIEIEANFLAIYFAVENIIDTLTQTKLWKQNYIKVNIIAWDSSVHLIAQSIKSVMFLASVYLRVNYCECVMEAKPTPRTYLSKSQQQQQQILYKTYRFYADARLCQYFLYLFMISFTF